MPEMIRGLKLDEAAALLKESGIEPEIMYADPPFTSFDKSGRTPRAVLYKGSSLYVSYFRDKVPEARWK